MFDNMGMTNNDGTVFPMWQQPSITRINSLTPGVIHILWALSWLSIVPFKNQLYLQPFWHNSSKNVIK